MRLPISGLSAILVRIAIAGMIAAPYWYWSGGLLEREATQFIQQYLDNRRVLPKVFDPQTNDLGTYQSREFSYFFDYLDAKAFAAMLSGDTAVFIPASAIAASLLTVLVFTVSVRSYALPKDTSGLLLLIYLSNYVHLVSMVCSSVG